MYSLVFLKNLNKLFVNFIHIMTKIFLFILPIITNLLIFYINLFSNKEYLIFLFKLNNNFTKILVSQYIIFNQYEI